jgi:hypothetical protein
MERPAVHHKEWNKPVSSFLYEYDECNCKFPASQEQSTAQEASVKPNFIFIYVKPSKHNWFIETWLQEVFI